MSLSNLLAPLTSDLLNESINFWQEKKKIKQKEPKAKPQIVTLVTRKFSDQQNTLIK